MPEAKRLADTLWAADPRRIDAMRDRRHNNNYPSFDFSDPDPNWHPSTPADWAARRRETRKKQAIATAILALILITYTVTRNV